MKPFDLVARIFALGSVGILGFIGICIVGLALIFVLAILGSLF